MLKSPFLKEYFGFKKKHSPLAQGDPKVIQSDKVRAIGVTNPGYFLSTRG